MRIFYPAKTDLEKIKKKEPFKNLKKITEVKKIIEILKTTAESSKAKQNHSENGKYKMLFSFINLPIYRYF